MSQHTVFGDLRVRATAVYRVKTQASSYLVGFHETEGKRFVVVRGEPGTDREHVIVRDSDPKIGTRSMFEVPLAEWPGKSFEVATMSSSTIVSVAPESDPQSIAAVAIDQGDHNPWARPLPADTAPDYPAARPAGMPASPRILPARARGTHPAQAAAVSPAPQVKPVVLPPAPHGVAKQVVVGGAAQAAEAEVPYPERHVLYAENLAALLRSISRRDRLFEDVRPDQRDRLRRSLDDAASLLEQIRRRDRK